MADIILTDVWPGSVELIPGTAASTPVKNRSLEHYKNMIRIKRASFSFL
jgi:hypothetical protein